MDTTKNNLTTAAATTAAANTNANDNHNNNNNNYPYTLEIYQRNDSFGDPWRNNTTDMNCLVLDYAKKYFLLVNF